MEIRDEFMDKELFWMYAAMVPRQKAEAIEYQEDGSYSGKVWLEDDSVLHVCGTAFFPMDLVEALKQQEK